MTEGEWEHWNDAVSMAALIGFTDRSRKWRLFTCAGCSAVEALFVIPAASGRSKKGLGMPTVDPTPRP